MFPGKKDINFRHLQAKAWNTILEKSAKTGIAMEDTEIYVFSADVF